MNTSTNGEWMSAQEALAFLGMPHAAAVRAICTRASEGMIEARAKRYISGDGRSLDDVDVPTVLWWAGGGEELRGDWRTGDFETMDPNFKGQLRAFGVEFRRSHIERMRPVSAANSISGAQGRKVFIGHGHSLMWRVLKDYLRETLKLKVAEFESASPAGIPTQTRLKEMLDEAAFAFLIMTAEDEQPNGKFVARRNVIHEVGLFQGRLGFERAIILLEHGCETFSNIDGSGQIRFPKRRHKRSVPQGSRSARARKTGLTLTHR